MIRHLLRLTWNRKRSTALVFLELAGCFLVLCAVVTALAFTISNWRRPLGFDYQNVLRVELGLDYHRAPAEKRRLILLDIQRMLAEVRALPEVQAVALAENHPYSTSEWSWTFKFDGREANVLWSPATDDIAPALGLQLERGRWFEPADAALEWQPVLITHNLARARFGDGDPLGQPLRSNTENPDPDDPDLRVVGVIADYRRAGETRPAPYSAFGLARFKPDDIESSDTPPRGMIVRVRPGTSANFEERLSRQLQSLLPNQSLDIESLEQARAAWLRMHMMPIVIATIVALFLLLMVGFGLVGVLWQSVTRRTSELGLRRALGATAANLRVQIVAELVAITTFAIALGALLFVQLPALGVFGFVPVRAYVYGLAGATLVLYCFVILCGLYPGWMATRVQPATALQHE